MKTFAKTCFRSFKRQITRFFTIMFIVFVSIGLMSGIGELKNKVNYAISNYYVSQNIPDLIIKSTKQTGFSPDEISKIQAEFGSENILNVFSMDLKTENSVFRIFNYNLNGNINKLEILEGNLPKNDNEILVERKTNALKHHAVGDEIKINIFGIEQTFVVSGIAVNPLIVHEVEEISYISGETLTDVIYLNSSLPLPTNDIYVSFENRSAFNNGKGKDAFCSAYKNKVNQTKQSVFETLGSEEIKVLSLYENYGLYSMHDYAEKVGTIALIFDFFFLLVTSLVIYSTMSRLLEEERSHIACLKTLGYSGFAILSKYLIFIALATIFGAIISLGVGIGLTNVLYISFNMQYKMPAYPTSMPYFYFLISLGIILIVALAVTLLSGFKLISTKPAKLLTHKAPPAGRKVLMEHISPVWNRLSFKYKSSYRNVFLFRSRFLMTVVSIMGSTILVLAGFGLLDNTLVSENTEAISLIAAALIVFAGLLCALVVYNITNINISERKREIASLMVLGYNDKEVSFYIFREIYIMSFIGAILGVPLGYGFLEFVFNLINFGKTSDVNWWTWILAPAITMVFAVLSSLMLTRKITKTDMNDSLKTLE